MQTVQPVLKRGRNCWDKVNMPEIEFKERVARLRTMMAKKRISAILLYGSGVSDYGNQSYISNYVPESSEGVVVIVPEYGEVTMIFEGVIRGLADVQSVTWISDIRATGNLARACSDYLMSKYPTGITIGIIGFRQLMPFTQWYSFLEYIGTSRVVDLTRVMQEMRMIKSSRESDQIRRTSRIIRQTFDKLFSVIYPEIKERIIEAEIEKYCYIEGAEDVRVLLAYPSNRDKRFRPVENERKVDKKSISIYLAVAYESYWAEGIRTYAIQGSGRVSSENSSKFQLMLRDLEKGMVISDFYNKISSDLKFSKKCSLYLYPGNSIGLALQEYPLITKDKNTRLKKGMCFTLRTICASTLGPIITGHTLLMTRNGLQILT